MNPGGEERRIRHALRKSGTVHIVDATTAIPFDVKQYRAISYSTDLAELPKTIDDIVAAINKRRENPARSDNPVHDTITTLPLDLRQSGDEALRRQLAELQRSLADAQKKNDELSARLAVLDPGNTLAATDNLDVDQLLDRADEVMALSGENVLLRLEEARERGGSAEFVKELRETLRSPYLSENDLLSIAAMCSRLGLKDHLIATLEVARHRYPGEEAFVASLAAQYESSPDRARRERGRLMLEEHTGVTHGPTGPIVEAHHNIEPITFVPLFDFYFADRRPEWVLSLAKSIEKRIGEDSIMLRNKGRALAKLGRIEEAEADLRRAVELNPADDLAHAFYADFLDDEGRYEEACEESERGILADPEDGDRVLNLVILILNRGFVRDESGSIVGPVPRPARIKYAVPLLEMAVRGSTNAAAVRQRAIGILVREKAIQEAQALQNDTRLPGAYASAAADHIRDLLNATDT